MRPSNDQSRKWQPCRLKQSRGRNVIIFLTRSDSSGNARRLNEGATEVRFWRGFSIGISEFIKVSKFMFNKSKTNSNSSIYLFRYSITIIPFLFL